MSNTYTINIITPQGGAYSGEVVHTLFPSEDGFVGVLVNHASYVASSPGGRLELREKDGLEKKFSVGAGFFEVTNNKATFLTQSVKERD